MKKIIPIIIALLLIAIGVICYIKYNNNEKEIVSTITLDINPSIEINLDKDSNVVNVIALNDDAKDIISSDLKGKSLNDALEVITNNVIDKGYAEGEYVAIILYSTGNVENTKIENIIIESFNKKQVLAEIITVEEVTEEDIENAKKYNISPAKAAYIEIITKESETLDIGDFSNKPVNELKDTKMNGYYCHDGYSLEGSWCVKEIGTKDPKSGEVCPGGYLEYKGRCYEETGMVDTGNIICPNDFTLENNECVRKITAKAVVDTYTCSKGMVKTKGEVGMAPFESGPARDPVCVDTKTTKPVTVCNLPKSDPTERLYYNGKCYWHRAPVISSGCPGKIKVKGFCWDSAEGIYMCANGYNSNKRTKDDVCYTVLKNVKPTIASYRCDDDTMTLEGTKCVRTETTPVINERVCPEKATLINGDRCINLDKPANKTSGLICDEENTRLKGNKCIVYERIEALHY